jgi:hypothetical protein
MSRYRPRRRSDSVARSPAIELGHATRALLQGLGIDLLSSTRESGGARALNAPVFGAWTLVDARWTPNQNNGVNPDNGSPEIAG